MIRVRAVLRQAAANDHVAAARVAAAHDPVAAALSTRHVTRPLPSLLLPREACGHAVGE